VWASGTHGTYVVTRDGAKTWKAAQVPGAEQLDLRDVEAFGDTVYLLASGPGFETIRSDDGARPGRWAKTARRGSSSGGDRRSGSGAAGALPALQKRQKMAYSGGIGTANG